MFRNKLSRPNARRLPNSINLSTRSVFAAVVLAAATWDAQAQTGANTNSDGDVHFRKVVLENKCADPMELAVAPDGRVIFAERGGALRIWKPDTKTTVEAAKFTVNYHLNGATNATWEDGLVGVALDPEFSANHWIYLFYSPTDADENRVSRFLLEGNRLAVDSEKILLRIPMQRNVCCHTGGSLAFDGAGNLFASTGDNTNPFDSDGFAPIDYRPGRSGWDAARSAGNTADLRGKILRIHPERDGSYTIPRDNLFPTGTPGTKPEIFVMGCRNPFRVSVDKPSGTLFWGDVGPDARVGDTNRGPAGLDEFNRTRKAGNFGWPFVLGDNKAYHAYDFATKTNGAAFDPQKPVNLSPNNTGLKELPPAQPAWIWYPYTPSVRFPALGSGSRAACAGPVYHFDKKLRSLHKLPERFDNNLFIYDWARNWIWAVKLDAKGNMTNIRRFTEQLNFKHPIEMELGPDGCLYVIEFGSAWEHNKDSQIVRLEYDGNTASVEAAARHDRN
jgi:cytochrome c